MVAPGECTHIANHKKAFPDFIFTWMLHLIKYCKDFNLIKEPSLLYYLVLFQCLLITWFEITVIVTIAVRVSRAARRGAVAAAASRISFFSLATLLKRIDIQFFTPFLLILVNFMLNCKISDPC